MHESRTEQQSDALRHFSITFEHPPAGAPTHWYTPETGSQYPAQH